MRAVVQRVSRAQVSVGGTVEGAIDGPGLCVLVGVARDDTEAEARQLADKVWRLRILGDDDGVMNRAAADVGAPLLLVSQFTLYADTSKGRRPSWAQAAPGDAARPLFDAMVAALRDFGATVETGVFGADMALELVNDGPVTVILDS